MARKAIGAVGTAVVGMLLNAGLGYALPAPDIWRIAVVAQAPAAALEIAQLFLPNPVPLFGVITFTVVTAYLWQALAQNRRAKPELTAPDEDS